MGKKWTSCVNYAGTIIKPTNLISIVPEPSPPSSVHQLLSTAFAFFLPAGFVYTEPRPYTPISTLTANPYEWQIDVRLVIFFPLGGYADLAFEVSLIALDAVSSFDEVIVGTTGLIVGEPVGVGSYSFNICQAFTSLPKDWIQCVGGGLSRRNAMIVAFRVVAQSVPAVGPYIIESYEANAQYRPITPP